MSNIDAAKKCFAENLNLFSHPQQSPEKYNLYKGLLFLAEAVEALEHSQNDTDHGLRQIAQQLQNIYAGVR